MIDEPAPPRRRGRGARASQGVPTPQLPRLEVPWAPLEIFSADQASAVIDTAFLVLEEVGLEIRHASARAIYARHGAIVDDSSGLVRLGRDIVTEFCGKAPEKFVIHARNPERDLHVGGNVVNFGPVNGAPHVTDRESGRRYGDIAAFRDILKLTHQLGILHWQGGVVLEPVDLPVSSRHLDIYLAHITLSDAVWAARGIGNVAARDAIAMCRMENGVSLEELAQRPRLMMVTNVNSPRRVDEEILDAVMTLARHGQCIVITPFTLMGAMAPVTLPGALAQQTAEALGVIALVEMIRPGTPAVIGGFTSNVDMRTGSPMFGTPEYVRATLGGAQIARQLKLPFRSSAVCTSPVVDAQATYETAASLWASIMGHCHLINHAAGWLEGGLTASFEKIVVDAEMLRQWAEVLKPQRFSAADLALEAIRETAPGGHFFGAEHTIARYETAFYRPLLSYSNNFENWRDAGAKTATDRAADIWRTVRDAYVAPPLDAAIAQSLIAYVAERKQEIADGKPLRGDLAAL